MQFASSKKSFATQLILASLLLFSLSALVARAQQPAAAASAASDGSATMGDMAHMDGHMSLHMHMTALEPLQPGDQAKADAIVADARKAMEPYKDYKKALADGYQIFMPNMKHQKMYHFTDYTNAAIAQQRFDPLRPTSLLYEPTEDGGYKLVGAMYTDRVGAPESELNQRIPLSIAEWHQHVNLCNAPKDQRTAANYFGKDAKFGLMGSIATQQACDAAGGTFQAHLFGWMVHVYPYEAEAKNIWSVDRDDDHGDGGQMKGMKMAPSAAMPAGMSMPSH